MTRALSLLLALSLGASLGPRTVDAQSAAAVLAQGARAYDDLEFDNAAGPLRPAPAFQGAAPLAPPGAGRPLIYLPATAPLPVNPGPRRPGAPRPPRAP